MRVPNATVPVAQDVRSVTNTLIASHIAIMSQQHSCGPSPVNSASLCRCIFSTNRQPVHCHCNVETVAADRCRGCKRQTRRSKAATAIGYIVVSLKDLPSLRAEHGHLTLTRCCFRCKRRSPPGPKSPLSLDHRPMRFLVPSQSAVWLCPGMHSFTIWLTKSRVTRRPSTFRFLVLVMVACVQRVSRAGRNFHATIACKPLHRHCRPSSVLLPLLQMQRGEPVDWAIAAMSSSFSLSSSTGCCIFTLTAILPCGCCRTVNINTGHTMQSAPSSIRGLSPATAGAGGGARLQVPVHERLGPGTGTVPTFCFGTVPALRLRECGHLLRFHPPSTTRSFGESVVQA